MLLQAWVDMQNRWSSHGDMIVQYAHCVKSRLRKYKINEVELYFDVWKSMNKRFQQRSVRSDFWNNIFEFLNLKLWYYIWFTCNHINVWVLQI